MINAVRYIWHCILHIGELGLGSKARSPEGDLYALTPKGN